MRKKTGQINSTDVARAAGISQATVSRTFSHPELVSAKTREKVMRAAKELGYEHEAASVIETGKGSNLVGVIVKDFQNPFYTAFVNQISQKLHRIGKQIILFAPTYRGQGRKTAYYPFNLIDFQALYQYCTEQDAVVLFKMHPWVSDPVPIPEELHDRLFDMKSDANINDLFYITDLLITDYSSSMYEFLLMNKPMLLFPFDKNQYSVSRGFHRDYDSNVPGKICMSFDELMTALRNRDYEYEKVSSFLSYYFDQVDTSNCDRVIDWLILDQLPAEYKTALTSKREHINNVRNLIIHRSNSSPLNDAVVTHN